MFLTGFFFVFFPLSIFSEDKIRKDCQIHDDLVKLRQSPFLLFGRETWCKEVVTSYTGSSPLSPALAVPHCPCHSSHLPGRLACSFPCYPPSAFSHSVLAPPLEQSYLCVCALLLPRILSWCNSLTAIPAPLWSSLAVSLIARHCPFVLSQLPLKLSTPCCSTGSVCVQWFFHHWQTLKL